MRLFTGFELNNELKEQLLLFKQTNKQPGLSFTQPDNLHITSFFIGEVYSDKLNTIQHKIESVCNNNSSILLTSNKIDFSPGKSPYMIWQYFNQNDHFDALTNQLMHRVKNIKPGINQIIPHITIARFKKPAKYFNIDPIESKTINLELNKLILWQSSLDNKSRKYIKLNEFQLINE